MSESLHTPVPGKWEMEVERTLYRRRFGEDLVLRDAIWKVLCRDFFQSMVPLDATVLDVGAGYCEFINNIQAKRRLAVDVNDDVKKRARSGVEAYTADAAVLPISDGEIDVVFSSNFLEHLLDKPAVLAVLREMRRVMREGGSLIILQPNIRFAYREYWDFFDHYTPLSDRSMVEALALVGFEPRQVIARFLPYTTKSRLPQTPALVWLYLRVRPVWHLMGKQMLIRAEAT